MTEQDTAKLGTLAIGDEQVEQIFLYIANADAAPDNPEAMAAMFQDAGVADYLDVYRGAYQRSQQ